MRFAPVLVLVLAPVLALSACDDSGPPGSPASDAERPRISAERMEAERACAELTGHAPDAPGATRAMHQREYQACVAAVTGGESPAPELRGRVDRGM